MNYYTITYKRSSIMCASCNERYSSNIVLSYAPTSKAFNTWRCCNYCFPDADGWERVTLRFYIKLFKKTKNAKIPYPEFTIQHLENFLNKELGIKNKKDAKSL